MIWLKKWRMMVTVTVSMNFVKLHQFLVTLMMTNE